MARTDSEIARIVRAEAVRMIGPRPSAHGEANCPSLPFTAEETLRMAELLDEALEREAEDPR